MDIFTHAVLPFALFAFLRRPLAERLAVGLGAAMPDMDFFGAWLTRLADPLYFFTHRGWTHTLWGAPLVGVAGLVVVTRPWWARRWARLGAFQLTPATAAAAAFGGLTHLGLDVLTVSGVPLLWPFSLARFTADFYFFSVPTMAPVAAWVVWRLLRGTLTPGVLRGGTAFLLTVLVLTGGLRAATYPWGAPPGSVVQPTPSELRWVVAQPVPGGWRVGDAGVGPFGAPGVLRGNVTPAAADAVERAQALGAYASWRWIDPTPLVNATPLPDGWRIEFRDAVALHRKATGGLLAGVVREPEPLVVEITPAGARVTQQPGFFGLGD